MRRVEESKGSYTKPMNRIVNNSVFKKKSLVGAISRVILGVGIVANVSFFSSQTFAQNSTSGSIYGKGEVGAAVTYKNQKTGLKRTITVGENGKFNFSNVLPGRYVVTDDRGHRQTVNVKVSQGVRVFFASGDIEEVAVVGEAIQRLDVAVSGSTSVFSKEELDLLPVAQNDIDIALMAPGTISGSSNFDSRAVSFSGASVAENGFYIDGFDVTNLRNMLAFSSVPYEATAQKEIKRGGYSAEYGRSLGGIQNTITRSGTNEFEFESAVVYSPGSWSASEDDIYSYDVQPGEDLFLETYRSKDNVSSLKYSTTFAGPIIQDKLFYMVNLQGRDYTKENFRRSDRQTEITTNNSPEVIAKLDWYMTDNHRLGVTYVDNENEEKEAHYDVALDAEGNPVLGKNGELDFVDTIKNGGQISIFNYTGYLSDNATLRLSYGESQVRVEHTLPQPLDPVSSNCVRAFDSTANSAQTVKTGCWDRANTTIDDPNAVNEDLRTGFRGDLEWVLGDHTLRIGFEDQEYTSKTVGWEYTGGEYWRHFLAKEGDQIFNGVPLEVGQNVARIWDYSNESGEFQSNVSALFIEDTWALNDEMTLYLGVRSDSFENFASNGQSFLKLDNLIAPRLGFSWDINGKGKHTLFGNLGRYYIPVANNTNIRLTRMEVRDTRYFKSDGFDPATGLPINLGEEIGVPALTSTVLQPETLATTDLEPMYQDELILGYSFALNQDWSFGSRIVARDVGTGMDDFCGVDAFINYAKDNGLTEFDSSHVDCIVLNPGRDVSIAIDHDGDTNTPGEVHVIPERYFGLEPYKRQYLGLELTADKRMSNGWSFNASYVLSRARGNVEGYVNSTLGQEDPGITQDFDHPLFLHGSQGDLPTDRRHQLKLTSVYQLSDEWAASIFASALSGAPLSCNGYIPLEGLSPEEKSNLNGYSASSFYCLQQEPTLGGDGNIATPEVRTLSSRGGEGRMPWQYKVDLGLTYRPNWLSQKLTLQAKVYNALNANTAVEFTQSKEQSRGNFSNDFLLPKDYQNPRYLELTARYQF